MSKAKDKGGFWNSDRRQVTTNRLKWLGGKLWTLLRIILPIYVALWVFSEFGGRGIFYLLLAFTIYIGVRIAMNWEQYMNILRYGEMKFFGKPLDKIHWQDEKPRIPKIVWRKTNGSGQDKRNTE